jgi:hypothetical protein
MRYVEKKRVSYKLKTFLIIIFTPKKKRRDVLPLGQQKCVHEKKKEARYITS